jgi:hypothetical protein
MEEWKDWISAAALPDNRSCRTTVEEHKEEPSGVVEVSFRDD